MKNLKNDGIAKTNWQVLQIMLFFSVLTLIFAFAAGNISETFNGFVKIMTSPAQLTIDYFKLGTVGGCFLNVAMTGFGCILVFALSGAELNGISLMAFFLTIGFAFFGMNFLNIWPCILGTWLFTRVTKMPFAKQVNIAVFSTALSPFVSEGMFRYPTGSLALSILLGILLGVIAGFLMPILCGHSPNLHKGYSLYNAAAVAGFIGIMLFSFLFRYRGVEIPSNTDIGEGAPLISNIYCVLACAACVVFGFVMNGCKLDGVKEIFKRTAYKTDYVKQHSVAITWINIGLFGLFVTAYYNVIGAKLTGPTVGSIICLLAVAPCGAHILNFLPIIIGYAIASIFGSWTLTTQAIIVGICFAAALTPIAGSFGPVCGIAAGFLHAMMVTTVVTFHGGMCLYNGGFTCGVTSIILVPVLEYFFKPSDTYRPALLPLKKQ